MEVDIASCHIAESADHLQFLMKILEVSLPFYLVAFYNEVTGVFPLDFLP